MKITKYLSAIPLIIVGTALLVSIGISWLFTLPFPVAHRRLLNDLSEDGEWHKPPKRY